MGTSSPKVSYETFLEAYRALHDMYPLRSTSAICISLLSIYCSIASSRHLHGHLRHRHHYPRQDNTPIPNAIPPASATLSNAPSATAGNTVVDDIEQIQNGLTVLPGDLLAFIQAVQERLEQVESALAGLLSISTPATDAQPQVPVTGYPELQSTISPVTTTSFLTTKSMSTALQPITTSALYAFPNQTTIYQTAQMIGG